jgi:hemerythrin superfamily protein
MGIMEKARTYVGMYAENDIRSHLHEDHEVIRSLAKDACEAGTPSSRAAAFKKLKPLLTAHARAEETVVYMRLVRQRKSQDSRDFGNEGFVEHTLVDALMAHIAATRPAGASDIWRARAKVLRELLDHHIDEEEKDVFEELGEHFSDEQREQMAAEFGERKAALLGHNRGTRRSSGYRSIRPSARQAQSSA